MGESTISQQSKRSGMVSLIKSLREIQKPWFLQLLACALFFLLMKFALTSWDRAIAISIGMLLHEYGHWLVFKKNKIKADVKIIFPLGAVCAPINEKEEEASDKLHWNSISWLLIAGPLVNVMLMLLGVVVLYLSIDGSRVHSLSMAMIEMNGYLAIFNLIPISNLDAGQLMHVIFSSLNESDDRRLTRIIGISAFIVIWYLIFLSPLSSDWFQMLINLVRNSGPIVFVLLFAAGIWHKQGKDNPLHYKSTQAMSFKQVLMHFSLYAGTCVVALLLFKL